MSGRSMSMIALLGFLVTGQAGAQEKKEKKKEPRIAVLAPLGAPAGKSSKVTIRGILLDKAKEVQVSGGGAAKILSKGAAPVPDKNPEQVGDTQVEAEIVLPEKVPEEGFQVTVVTTEGTTKPQRLVVETKFPVIAEKEPNPGFRQAQEVKLPVVIEGTIGNPRDVDVFRFDGKAGQKVRVSVLARQHGSPLDPLVSLYTGAAAQLSGAKVAGEATWEWTLPRDEALFLTLIDAHDSGSAIHVYRLRVEVDGK